MIRTVDDQEIPASGSKFHCLHGLLAKSQKETPHAQSRDAERGKLITGKWPGDLWRCADKLVQEAENAVYHQVNVKMLTRQSLSPAQPQNHPEHQGVEN